MSTASYGWQQVRAGLALIKWSGLADWESSNARLTPKNETAFENVANERDVDFGRVISWVVFAVGCEYFLKGVCSIRGLAANKQPKIVLRPPKPLEMPQWINHALTKHASVMESVSEC